MICRCLDGEGRLVARLIPQSIRLSRDEQAPADGLEMTFPLAGLPAVARVELSGENGVIFAGIVDEQNETYTAEERQTELVCRSFEAVLLDNPAYAGTIRNPSRTVLEYGQLRPLGLVCTGGPENVFRGSYTVSNRASVYTALADFSKLYGTGAVWMPDAGTVSLDRRPVQNWRLEKFLQAQVIQRPCERISEVIAQSSVSGCYNAVSINEAAQKAGVVRRKFLKACSPAAAKAYVEAGERAAFALVLTTPVFLNIHPGDRVSADLSIWNLPLLVDAEVQEVLARRDNSGDSTRIRLAMPEM